MNKLEISGIQNLKGFKVGGWEIYHIEERPLSYFIKLRPETNWENARHAAVQFDKTFIKDDTYIEYGGKKIHTIIAYESFTNIIHEEEVFYNLFKTKNEIWMGIVNIIEQKGALKYGR